MWGHRVPARTTMFNASHILTTIHHSHSIRCKNPLNVLLWMTLLAWFYLWNTMNKSVLCLFRRTGVWLQSTIFQPHFNNNNWRWNQINYDQINTDDKPIDPPNKQTVQIFLIVYLGRGKKTNCIHKKNKKITPYGLKRHTFKLDSIDLVKYSVSFWASIYVIASICCCSPSYSLFRLHWIENDAPYHKRFFQIKFHLYKHL